MLSLIFERSINRRHDDHHAIVPVLALALASLWFCCPCVGSIHPYTRRRTAVRQSPPARTRSLELPEH